MYFTRSDGPLLSVIIPSRQRFNELISTIQSFTENASNPNNVEFLVKLDSDDMSTISQISSFPKNTKTLVYERMRGYFDLHHFVNDLCKLSNGDWILLFNDDAKMITKGWDELLENVNPSISFSGNKDICLINPGSPYENHTEVFPIIRKKSFDYLGHFSLHAHNDAWVQDVFGKIDARLDLPEVKIKHLNNEICDDTRKHSADAQNTSFADWESFSELRQKDSDLLKKILVENK